MTGSEMNMKLLAIGLFLSSILIGSCNFEETPPDLIEEDTYVDLLVELQLLKSYRQSAPVDTSEVDSLKQVIYRKYRVSEEQFRISHRYYQEDPDKQEERVDAAIERLRMDQVESDSTQPWLMRQQ
jgi:hypothetical protein